MHKSDFIDVSLIERFSEGGISVRMRVEGCDRGWAGARRLRVRKQAVSLVAITLYSRTYRSLEN